MSGKCFVDSNVWLYAFIDDGTFKSQQAREFIKDQPKNIWISSQVINEVSVNLLKKAAIKEEHLHSLIVSFYKKYNVIDLRKDILLRASQLRTKYSVSFWDSLIGAACLASPAEELISEDMHHGLVLEGKVKIRNPLKPAD